MFKATAIHLLLSQALSSHDHFDVSINVPFYRHTYWQSWLIGW